MRVVRLIRDVEFEEIPSGEGVYYTHVVPVSQLCMSATCDLDAHIGIMTLGDISKDTYWGSKNTSDKIEGEITYWCALDYVKAINGAIEPESEPPTMTEEEMMESWETGDG
jgi:hypothetical protein